MIRKAGRSSAKETSAHDQDDVLRADLVVIGAGMAGMTAAAAAAEQRAHVLVVERAPSVGGSAALSEGYVWTAPDMAALLKEDPGVDRRLAQVLIGDFAGAVAWLDGLGLNRSPVTGILGFGQGIQIDIHDYLRRCRTRVEAAGGWVLTNSNVDRLLVDRGRVTGVRADEASITAPYTLIATGGFQGGHDMVNEFIRPARVPLFLRANMTSTGDGIRLGRSVGAGLAGDMAAFYGHVMPSPLTRELIPSEYTAFTQYHSAHGILVDMGGRRFVDESLGDHISAQEIARLPGGRAVLIADERIRQEQVLRAFIAGMDSGVDKFELAAEAGAHLARGGDPEELAAAASGWGPPAEQLAPTIRAFNDSLAAGAEMEPRRSHFLQPVTRPPLVALEVQAAITFTYGGLRTDEDGRVLDSSGNPIPGLLAAGVDAGGLYRRGFAGGLVRGLVFGLRAGRLAVAAE